MPRGSKTPYTGATLAVCEGGPWSGHWYYEDNLRRMQEANRRTGNASTLNGYQPTDRYTDSPVIDGAKGRVYTYRPAASQPARRTA